MLLVRLMTLIKRKENNMNKDVVLQNEILEIRNKLDELLNIIQNPYGDLDKAVEQYRYLSVKLETAINQFQNSNI
jgi:hypothetical protein